MRHRGERESGPAPRGEGEARLRSRHRYSRIPLRPPKRRGRRKVYPGPRAPAASPRTIGAELTRARDPSGSKGRDPDGGPRLGTAPSHPGQGRRDYRPSGRQSWSGSSPGAGRGRRGAPRRGRTHRAELLCSVLHAPGSGSGTGCSPVSPACAAAAPRLRSASPALPRPPGPRPSPQPGPAPRPPRPGGSQPRTQFWDAGSPLPLPTLPPTQSGPPKGHSPGTSSPCVLNARLIPAWGRFPESLLPPVPTPSSLRPIPRLSRSATLLLDPGSSPPEPLISPGIC